MKMELRVNQAEFEANSDGSLTVSGYVNKTEKYSQMLGRTEQFKEKIAKGAFNRALEKAKDIHFLAEHDNLKVLASTRNGSLQLKEDGQGLYMSAKITPTTWGKDYYELIKSGILQNMSFGFRAVKDSWNKTTQGYFERTVHDLELFEVSVVRDPAYSQSTISARGIDVVEDIEIPANVKTQVNGDMEEMNKKALIEMRNELNEKIDEINTQLDEKEVRNNMEVLSVTERNTELEQEKRAIKGVLSGDFTEARSIGMGSNPGSLTVPTNVSAYIVQKLFEVAPLFARTKQFPSSSGFLSILKETDLGAAQWLDENEVASPSDFAMDSVKLQQKRVTAAVELSQQLINDSAIDVVTYALDLMVKRLSMAIERSIINGDGVKQPLGILNANIPTSIVQTQAVGAISTDDILALYNSINPQLVEGSVFVVSRPVFNILTKLKNGMNDYYLVDFKSGEKGTPMYQILGLPVLISDVMPQSAVTGDKAVALVNFGEAYAVMVKKGMEMKHIFADTTQALRGSHLLLTDAYIDGNVINEQAIKILSVK